MRLASTDLHDDFETVDAVSSRATHILSTGHKTHILHLVACGCDSSDDCASMRLVSKVFVSRVTVCSDKREVGKRRGEKGLWQLLVSCI